MTREEREAWVRAAQAAAGECERAAKAAYVAGAAARAAWGYQAAMEADEAAAWATDTGEVMVQAASFVLKGAEPTSGDELLKIALEAALEATEAAERALEVARRRL